ncbi:MAG: hypothetical protein KF688_01185 [Pirellulales bacterium]|nr:hypothetical protein [Pirellulales bacterium]
MQRQASPEHPEALSAEMLSAHQPLPANVEIRCLSGIESYIDYWAEVAAASAGELFAMTVVAIRKHHDAAQVHHRLAPEHGSIYSLGVGKLIAFYSFHQGVVHVRGYAPNLPDHELPNNVSDCDAMAFGGYYS